MLNSQRQSLQGASGIPEICTGIVSASWDAQLPSPATARLSRLPSQTQVKPHESRALKNEAVAKVPTLSGRSFNKILAKRSTVVYKIDGFYVGLLKDLPPPTEVLEKWEQDVRNSLENHLCQATSKLAQSMRDEDVVIEPVLCMAGKKCSPDTVTMPVGTPCPKDPVSLEPTVWIYCGSRKCKKKVLDAIKNLAYLNHFIRRFCMQPPHASLQAPWPAAGESSIDVPALKQRYENLSFALQWPDGDEHNISGLKVRFTAENPLGTVEHRVSTIGGLIYVNDVLYGLTSAHGIVSYITDAARSRAPSEDYSNREDSSTSESETNSQSDSESDSGPDHAIAREAYEKVATPDREKQSIVSHDESNHWVKLELPKVLSYLGRGTIDGDYSFPTREPNTSDFALVELSSLPLQTTTHQMGPTGHIQVTEYLKTSQLHRGEVAIIVTAVGDIVPGYLLEGDASLIIRGVVMRTKKIQTERPGVAGISGAWVVREGKFCGSIYAAYHKSPYLHMIPAENMFRDITEVLPRSKPRLPLYQRHLGRKPETLVRQASVMLSGLNNVVLKRDDREGITTGEGCSGKTAKLTEAEAHARRSGFGYPTRRLTITISSTSGLRPSKRPYFVCQLDGSEYISAEANDSTDTTKSNEQAVDFTSDSYNSRTTTPPIAMGKRRTSSNLSSPRNLSLRPDISETSDPEWEDRMVFDVYNEESYLEISLRPGQNSAALLGHAIIKIGRMDEKDGPQMFIKSAAIPADPSTKQARIVIKVEQDLSPISAQKARGPEEFLILKLVGKGATGQVFLVQQRDTKQAFALKAVSKKALDGRAVVQRLPTRLKVSSPFVVNPEIVFQTNTDLYLLSDYKYGGELFWHLQREGRFGEERARFYIAEIVQALTDYHEQGIILGNLKPEWILLDAFGHIAICDNYVVSKPPSQPTSHEPLDTPSGNVEYMAPELLLDEKPPDHRVDFWSLGVLAFEMCCGWSPFYAEDVQQMYKNIAFGKVRFPRDALSAEGRNFIKSLMNRNPNHRLGQTSNEIKGHAFFSGIDWNALARREVPPPFRPEVKRPGQTESSTGVTLDEQAAALANPLSGNTLIGSAATFAGSTLVDVQSNFEGFTFVDEASLQKSFEDDGKLVSEQGETREWGNPITTKATRGGIGKELERAYDDEIFFQGDFDV